MKKFKGKFLQINIVLILILAVSVGYKLYLSDKVATVGSDYNNQYDQLIALKKENEKLSNEYYSLTSIQSIKDRSIEFGYTNRSIDYMTPHDLASR